MFNIAILGLGVVGGGLADLITKNEKLILERTGEEVCIKYILDIRDLPDSPYYDKIVKDINIIIDDPEVALVAECIGGSHPAVDFTEAALRAGKHVVTSNKEVVANFGERLLALAAENNVNYLFEASVGGGIPVLRALDGDLAANRIEEITGIVNGTTNYILTRMFESGCEFGEALAEAQAKGYAEANPSADVDGIDTCRKICILTALAGGVLPDVARVHTEGIREIRRADAANVSSLGARIKLLGRMTTTPNGETFILVAPFVVRESSPLYCVNDVYNAIMVRGNFVGDVMFYGQGAGALPTASAVAGDIVSLVGNASPERRHWVRGGENMPDDFTNFVSGGYMAVSGVDRSAVGVVFGDVEFIEGEEGETAFVYSAMSERENADRIARLEACGATVLSKIRILD